MNFEVNDKVIINEKGITFLKCFGWHPEELRAEYTITSFCDEDNCLIAEGEDIRCKNFLLGKEHLTKVNQETKEKKKNIIINEIDALQETLIKENKKIEGNKKEERGIDMKLDGMMKKMFGEIGKLETGVAALTFGGAIAFKRKDGDYVRYNEANETIDNQMDFVAKGTEKMMFLMPVNIVNVGDVLKHKGEFVQVIKVNPNGSLRAIKFETGTKTTILKETNIFGMQFYSKVVSMFDMKGMTGMAGINPMALMMMSKSNNEDEDFDIMSMMMMSQMFNGQQSATGGMMQGINPAMMMCMMNNESDSSDMMNMMMMSQMFQQGGNGGIMNGIPINHNQELSQPKTEPQTQPCFTDEQFKEILKKLSEKEAVIKE